MRSFRRGSRIVDADNSPIPWFTYPSIAYLNSLDLRSARVLEFGSGSSTLFWERRCGSVVSVEHDADWHAALKRELRSSTRYILATDEESYVTPVDPEARFDVIAVDGAFRRRCIDTALKQRADGGIIVLDNSDWFPDLAHTLRSSGLIQVDFTGFVALLSFPSITSVWLDGRNPPIHTEGGPLLPRGAPDFWLNMANADPGFPRF